MSKTVHLQSDSALAGASLPCIARVAVYYYPTDYLRTDPT